MMMELLDLDSELIDSSYKTIDAVRIIANKISDVIE
jgi:hypothetical protein